MAKTNKLLKAHIENIIKTTGKPLVITPVLGQKVKEVCPDWKEGKHFVISKEVEETK